MPESFRGGCSFGAGVAPDLSRLAFYANLREDRGPDHKRQWWFRALFDQFESRQKSRPLSITNWMLHIIDMIKRRPKRLRNPVADAPAIKIENSVPLSEAQEPNSSTVDISKPPGGFIIGTVVGLAGLAGYMGWPLYIIPILAVGMVTGVEIANSSLVGDAQHARMNILLYTAAQVGLHCVTGGILYTIGFGLNYLVS